MNSKGYYKLTIRGGRTYTGFTKGDIIQKMRAGWFGEDLTKIEYKDEVSKRVFEMYGKVLNRSRFIDSLCNENLAKIEFIRYN